MHMTNFLHEQRMSAQACLTSGLLLTGALYLVRAEVIPRGVVLETIVLVTIGLALRRLIYRILLYRRFDRGLDTRNVLIVGTGLEGTSAPSSTSRKSATWAYTFKGFIELPGCTSHDSVTSDIVGNLESLFLDARKQFHRRNLLHHPMRARYRSKNVLEQARAQGVDLRVVPDLYDGLAWNSPHRIHRPVSYHPPAPRRVPKSD